MSVSEVHTYHAAWIVPAGIFQENFFACRARAKQFIMERLRVYAHAYALDYGRVRVKDMKTRWGSCSYEKHLNFHYRLLFLPIELADYVIIHELCHLVHLNHAKSFWDLVAQAVPDYKKRRRELRRYRLQ